MSDTNDPAQGDVIPPNEDRKAHSIPPLNGEDLNVLALISNYTDRPDLFLEAVERHDPGFIMRMNESARAHSEQLRQSKFKFGERQAYTALVVSVIAAFVILGAVIYALFLNAGPWTIIALTLCYGVTQGGTRGFGKIAAAFAELVSKVQSKGHEK